MTLPIVNSAEDLAAIKGTMEYTEFLALLEGSLWRIERDEDQQAFVAIEDNSTIERYGLTRADFPNAQPPALPEWTPLPSTVPKAVSPYQAKAALLDAGLLDDVLTLVNDPAADPKVVLAWNNALSFERASPMVAGIAAALTWTEEQLDALFEAAAQIS